MHTIYGQREALEDHTFILEMGHSRWCPSVCSLHCFLQERNWWVLEYLPQYTKYRHSSALKYRSVMFETLRPLHC